MIGTNNRRWKPQIFPVSGLEAAMWFAKDIPFGIDLRQSLYSFALRHLTSNQKEKQ